MKNGIAVNEKKTIYSASRIKTYVNCPCQFYWKYVEELDPEFGPAIESYLGNAVHEALHVLYDELQKGNILTLDQLLSLFEEQWQDGWDERTRMPKPFRTPEWAIRRGREMLSGYYDSHFPFDAAEILGLEFELSTTLSGGAYRYRAIIDRLARTDDDIIEVHDYKTSSRMPTPGQLKADMQVVLYAKAALDEYPEARGVRLVWHYLAFNEEIVLELDREELEAVLREVELTIADIELRGSDERNFPAKPSGLCPWCDYYGICPAGGGRRQRPTLFTPMDYSPFRQECCGATGAL